LVDSSPTPPSPEPAARARAEHQGLSTAERTATGLAAPPTGPERKKLKAAPEEELSQLVQKDAPLDDGVALEPDQNAEAIEHNTEAYDAIAENRFISAANQPLSTFSVDVDTASYSNTRRFLREGQTPPKGAVRIEELVNYFDYDYPAPQGDAPFSVYTEIGDAPWASGHRLVHVGLQGRSIALEDVPPRNLVFLLDVSGSMNDPNKLPLLKRSFGALVETLSEKDTVAITVYAGASGLVLPATPGSDRRTILSALERLEAGGSTNGGEGIRLAYSVARAQQKPGGINRVVLATDGDFNVGTTSHSELLDLIEQERKSGVFLTVLGFGMGNYNDSTLEKIADHGNGNYAYIDSDQEARKVLVQQANATLITIAKDVKIQIEFNPHVVGAYRLIGYENRALRDQDFHDDKKDAGDIGAGHTVTALYEIVTPDDAKRLAPTERLKYQVPTGTTANGEALTVKLRFKRPNSDVSELMSVPVANRTVAANQTSESFRFSSAVAAFGMTLRQSEHKGAANFPLAKQLATRSLGQDPHGYRREFISLIDAASRLSPQQSALAR
jgi:Ca-activated chloride channel family protein